LSLNLSHFVQSVSEAGIASKLKQHPVAQLLKTFLKKGVHLTKLRAECAALESGVAGSSVADTIIKPLLVSIHTMLQSPFQVTDQSYQQKHSDQRVVLLNLIKDNIDLVFKEIRVLLDMSAIEAKRASIMVNPDAAVTPAEQRKCDKLVEDALYSAVYAERELQKRTRIVRNTAGAGASAVDDLAEDMDEILSLE